MKKNDMTEKLTVQGAYADLQLRLIELKCYLTRHEFLDELKCVCGERQTVIVK